MKLTLTKIIPSPLGKHLHFINILESQGAFLLGDRNKVVLIRADGSLELIANLDEEEYQRGDMSIDFRNEIMRKRVDGFKLLNKDEQARFTQSEIYKSARYVPVVNYAHDGALLFFSGKSIALLKWEEEQLVELKRIKTKGRDPISRALSPQQNLLLYGTNHGELYSQAFDRDGFFKSSKVDQLPNTCYQITFSADGGRLFVGGLGFIKFYNFDGKTFSPVVSLTTAMRSFELVEDYIFVNKGMHGLDVIRMKDKPERVTSLDPPFMIDKMYYLAPQKTFLLISGSTNEWALLNWND